MINNTDGETRHDNTEVIAVRTLDSLNGKEAASEVLRHGDQVANAISRPDKEVANAVSRPDKEVVSVVSHPDREVDREVTTATDHTHVRPQEV